ncbi:MAG: RIP metalloprotease RseP [candidate division Zixibacteria bacterium]|nr:RIP metalloprotease RseP [candidate division Zixibacteria bacterium]
MLTNIVSFVFVLGILVFIHELGHFLVAKRVGIKVERFSLGFPPNIFSKLWRGTTYCIGIIPLGGYVKMAGEQPTEEATGAPDEFMSKSVGQRAAVIFAGPFMNYVLAILLLIGIFYFGGRPLADQTRVLVGEVVEDSPAEKAGLKADDVIIAINGEPVIRFDSLARRINAIVEKPLDLTWVHGQDTITSSIVTMAVPVPNAEGSMDTIGLIGFNQKIIGYEEYGLWESITKGTVTAHVLVGQTVQFLSKLVSGQVSPKAIGGPLFIAQQSGREAKKGASNLFLFMALLSVNLAIINVLPIPVLDGGQLIFLAIEKFNGSPLSMKVRIIAQQVGIVLVLSLIVMVTYNDIIRVIQGF